MDLSKLSFEELNTYQVPFFRTIEELVEFIKALCDRPHDYNTAVPAMSLAAVAAFNYVGYRVGASGFQASCADLSILRHTRGLKCGMVIDFENALYPQYNLQEKLQKALDNAKPWLAEEAKKKLDELKEDCPVHPEVLSHWKNLAGVAQ